MVQRALYRGLLRVIRDYDVCHIPCLLPALGDGTPTLLTAQLLRRTPASHHGGPSETAAMETLKAMRDKLALLQGAEAETRSAMAQWQLLLLRHAGRGREGFLQVPRGLLLEPLCTSPTGSSRAPPDQPGSVGSTSRAPPSSRATSYSPPPGAEASEAEAAEAAALLISQLHRQTLGGIPPADDEDEDAPGAAAWAAAEAEAEGEGGGDGSPEGTARWVLDGLADGIRQAHPDLFCSSEAGQVSISSSASEEETEWVVAASHTASSAEAAPSRHSSHIQMKAAEAVLEAASEAASRQGLASSAGERHGLRVRAIASALFQGPSRFRNAPVEWVYDGLAPLLLPEVLRRRKGVPLALALVLCCVARRLGVAAVLLCEAETAGPGAGAVEEEEGMPLETAARQAGRAVLAAPSPEFWIVAFPPPLPRQTVIDANLAAVDGGSKSSSLLGPEASGCARFVDVGRKPGSVLSLEQLLTSFPAAASAYVSVCLHKHFPPMPLLLPLP